MKNFFTERTNFPKDFEKRWSFSLLNERILEQQKKTVFFTERTILLNERLHWTNDFTERSFNEKTNEIDEKWTIILRTNEIIF